MEAKFFGKYKGIVTHNVDPKKLLRIRAKVPGFNNNEPLNWAYPCKDYLGKDCGEIKLPGKGDGVWIEFEGGDPDYPIHVGMWASKDDIPSEFLSSYNENTFLKKDKNGNTILMDSNGINFNKGDKGIAREDDTIISNSGVDSTFWTFLLGHIHIGVTTGAGVSGPPGAPPSAPSSLTGKINQSSNSVKAGD